MATEITPMPRALRLRMTRDALAEMAQGSLTERLKLEAAARILRTAQRAQAVTGARLAMPPVMAGWDAASVTALEYVEGLSPAALDSLLAEGPRWAAALLREEPELRHAA